MKKSLLFATLVGAALTGCVNEEVATDLGKQKEMLFGNPALKTQTRANVLGEISGTSDYGDENFQVYAWTYQGNYAEKTWNDLTRFFSEGGEEASKGQTYWNTETTHYWPGATYNVLFAAYSPSTFDVKVKNDGTGEFEAVQSTTEKPVVACAPTVTYDGTGVTIAGFKVQSVADYQYDLMYSDYAVDRNVTNNGSTAVNLQFNHALSSIIFSAAATKVQDDVHYEIVDADLVGNFYTGGTFKQNIGGTPAWTSEETDKKACVYSPTFSTYTVTEDPGQFTQGRSAMLLIPQTVPAEAVLRLTYNKKSPSATLTTTVDIPLKDFVATKQVDGVNQEYSIAEWKPGVRYVYRIAFGENKPIFFNPTVSNWVEEPVAIYTISY